MKRYKKQRPEWIAWRDMLSRCNNPKNKRYKDYGGRGITVDEEFTKFEAFDRYMGPRPSNKHSLDRIKNDEGYKRGNMQWATRAQQDRNRRNTVFVTMGTKILTIPEWARLLNVSIKVLRYRKAKGLSDMDILLTPVRLRHKRSIFSEESKAA